MSGVRKEDIRRGDVIAAKSAVSVTGMLDVKLKIFDSSERMVLNNSRVHLYCGSKEVLTKVILMGPGCAVRRGRGVRAVPSGGTDCGETG